MSVLRKIAFSAMGLALASFSAAAAPAPVTEAPKPPSAAAPAPASGPVYREFVWGAESAKVTVIEYASLTCPHCAVFTRESFPKLKKDYIDTGKIKFVFRDYPLDGLALAGALLARCAPGDRGKTLIELMFKNQTTWVTSEKPLEPLKGYAKLAGMSDPDVEACLKNEQMADTIKQVQNTATTVYKVKGTPTFFVNDEIDDEGQNYEPLVKMIDKALAKNTK